MKSKSTQSIVVALLFALVFPFLMGAYASRNCVMIRDEKKPMNAVMTHSEDPTQILEEAGIVLDPFDTYTFEKQKNGLFRLNIRRAIKVKLVCNGGTSTVSVLDGTVADVIKNANFPLGEEDIVTPPLDEKVTARTVVTVQRVTYESSTVTQTIPFETTLKYSPLLKEGKTRSLVDGVNGEQTVTTVTKCIDGVPVETVSTSTNVTKEPVPAVTLVGDPKATVTTLEVPSTLTLDENGVPTSYKTLVTGKGTAYSAKKGAKTASGRYAIPGHVAVNPDVIPYGSKLYIRSKDGSFAYGYAIAADTGIALLDGRVTVDLFFDTYLESCLFGAKTMEIYVLE